MTVRASRDGAVEIVVTDDVASVCSGAPVDDDRDRAARGRHKLVIPAPVFACDDGSEPVALSGPPLQEQLRNLTFVHDAQAANLTDNLGSVWLRVTAPPSPTSAAPSTSPSSGAEPTPSTSPRPFPSPGFSRFDSPLHGVSIDYPAGWEIRPATEPWRHDAVTFDASDVDVIFDPMLRDDLYIAVVSEPLNGRAPGDWCCGPLLEPSQVCSAPDGSEGGGGGGAYTLHGARGWAGSCGDDVAGNHYVFVATAERGYVFRFHMGDQGLMATHDWAWFEAVLQTVDFRPEQGLPTSIPSSAP